MAVYNSPDPSHPAVPMTDTLLPQGEDLRRAVRWLSEQRDYSARAIEDAARRFNLSPRDEEFLLRHFLHADRGGDGRES